MSETVSTRVPKELLELMLKEASARGISLSTLFREIIEEHYGLERPKSGEPFIVALEKAIKTLGEKKAESCLMRNDCPLKAHGIEPSTIVCGICQVHDHYFGPLKSSIYNPLG